MAWKTMDAESQKLEFIKAWESGVRTFVGLCEQFGITRQCGYKWVRRYKEEGWGGLKERSRAPRVVPHKTTAQTEEELFRVRKEHASWGPRKLLVVLERERPELALPAASTVGGILRRAGLVEPRRRRTHFDRTKRPASFVAAVNNEWAIDYKGQFKMLNGRYCYPLTVSDLYSRYLLACDAFGQIRGLDVLETLENLFREFGLPEAIRSDNGPPFCGRGLGGVSRVGVWLMKLGITHVRTRPGHPEDNGRHERMHRGLKAETTRPPGRHLKDQQRRFDAWRKEFNEVRPHEALGMQTPGKVYLPSRRVFPEKLMAPEYPAHYEVRRVTKGGWIRWRDRCVQVSQALYAEHVGLLEIEDDLWRVYFGSIELGVIDDRRGWNDPRGKRVSTMCSV
jgi:transposase InsO family protein